MTARHRTLHETAAAPLQPTPATDSFGEETKEAEVARRGVLVRVSPEMWRSLKMAAIARGTTVQSLMLDAIQIALNRHEEVPAPGRRTGP